MVEVFYYYTTTVIFAKRNKSSTWIGALNVSVAHMYGNAETLGPTQKHDTLISRSSFEHPSGNLLQTGALFTLGLVMLGLMPGA